MRDLIIKRIPNPNSNKTSRVFTDEFGNLCHSQKFCCAWRIRIKKGKLVEAKKSSESPIRSFNGFVKDKLKEGNNIVIYWEDRGAGSYAVNSEDH